MLLHAQKLRPPFDAVLVSNNIKRKKSGWIQISGLVVERGIMYIK